MVDAGYEIHCKNTFGCEYNYSDLVEKRDCVKVTTERMVIAEGCANVKKSG